MDETQEIRNAPRADTLRVASGDGVHDRWALHAFAFEQNSGWLPVHLRRYHKDREIDGELMEGYYDEYIPVTHDSERGRVMKKQVQEQTAFCDECKVVARTYDNDTFCPECGLLCTESQASDNLVRDEKAANRLTDDAAQ